MWNEFRVDLGWESCFDVWELRCLRWLVARLAGGAVVQGGPQIANEWVCNPGIRTGGPLWLVGLLEARNNLVQLVEPFFE